jgi:hypothetical protein
MTDFPDVPDATPTGSWKVWGPDGTRGLATPGYEMGMLRIP